MGGGLVVIGINFHMTLVVFSIPILILSLQLTSYISATLRYIHLV